MENDLRRLFNLQEGPKHQVVLERKILNSLIYLKSMRTVQDVATRGICVPTVPPTNQMVLNLDAEDAVDAGIGTMTVP